MTWLNKTHINQSSDRSIDRTPIPDAYWWFCSSSAPSKSINLSSTTSQVYAQSEQNSVVIFPTFFNIISFAPWSRFYFVCIFWQFLMLFFISFRPLSRFASSSSAFPKSYRNHGSAPHPNGLPSYDAPPRPLWRPSRWLPGRIKTSFQAANKSTQARLTNLFQRRPLVYASYSSLRGTFLGDFFLLFLCCNFFFACLFFFNKTLIIFPDRSCDEIWTLPATYRRFWSPEFVEGGTGCVEVHTDSHHVGVAFHCLSSHFGKEEYTEWVFARGSPD